MVSFLPLLLSVGLSTLAFGGLSSADSLRKAEQSLVRVEGMCSHGDHDPRPLGSGFFWESSNRVVTTLHVVSGCETVFVKPAGSARRKATVERVLSDSDLVLLHIPDRPGLVNDFQFLTDFAPASPGDSLRALGFTWAAKVHRNKPIEVNTVGNRLRDILPDERSVRKIQLMKVPSLDVIVIDLNGELYPGMSGGPLLNSRGELIGVVQGGLDRGARGISWGIPSGDLTRLLKSSEAVELGNLPILTDAGYSHDRYEFANAATAAVAGFFKIRSARFEELVTSADNYQRISATYSSLGIDLTEAKFDIYADTADGVTLCIPHGVELMFQSGRVVASFEDSSWGIAKIEYGGRRLGINAAKQALLFARSTYLRVLPGTAVDLNVNQWSDAIGDVLYASDSGRLQYIELFRGPLTSPLNVPSRLLRFIGRERFIAAITLQLDGSSYSYLYGADPSVKSVLAQMVIGVMLSDLY